jgi:hypothetical protein
MIPAISTDPGHAGLAGAGPDASGRPLSAIIDAARAAVQEVLDISGPEDGYTAIARLSGHLAAMWRTVYPLAAARFGADRQLQEVCLRRARTVAWTLRLLECQLSGEVSAVGRPVKGVAARLAEHLSSYRTAEQALVTWIEDRLTAARRDQLARDYRRALTRAPTRPTRGARVRGRCAAWRSGCTAGGTGCSTGRTARACAGSPQASHTTLATRRCPHSCSSTNGGPASPARCSSPQRISVRITGYNSRPASVSRYSYLAGCSLYCRRSRIPAPVSERRRAASVSRGAPVRLIIWSKRRLPRNTSRTASSAHFSPTIASVRAMEHARG